MSFSFAIYEAAPFRFAAEVRRLQSEVRSRGFVSMGRWALAADGPELLAERDPAALRRAAEENDLDILRSDAVVVLARPDHGGEMFAEARFALMHDIPVVWVGRLILSAFRRGVVARVSSVDEMWPVLEELSRVIRPRSAVSLVREGGGEA